MTPNPEPEKEKGKEIVEVNLSENLLDDTDGVSEDILMTDDKINEFLNDEVESEEHDPLDTDDPMTKSRRTRNSRSPTGSASRSNSSSDRSSRSGSLTSKSRSSSSGSSSRTSEKSRTCTPVNNLRESMETLATSETSTDVAQVSTETVSNVVPVTESANKTTHVPTTSTGEKQTPEPIVKLIRKPRAKAGKKNNQPRDARLVMSSKSRESENTRERINKILDSIMKEVRSLGRDPGVIEKAEIENSINAKLSTVADSLEDIPKRQQDTFAYRLRKMSQQMENYAYVPRSIRVTTHHMSRGLNVTQFAQDLVSGIFYSFRRVTVKHYILSLILTILFILSSASAMTIDNNIQTMYVNESKTVKLLHPLSKLNVMTFSENHRLNRFDFVTRNINHLIDYAQHLANFSLTNKFCSTRRSEHAPAESMAILEQSKLEPDISYEVPHLEITSDFYMYESFAKNGTCYFRINPDIAGMLGKAEHVQWIDIYNWKHSREQPTFEYVEKNVDIDERTKHHRGVCKFYPHCRIKTKTTREGYYAAELMPVTKLLGCMIKCHQQSNCLYSAFNHKDSLCYFFARTIPQHDLTELSYNWWYESYTTVASAECIPTVLDRTRAYIMTNGTMVNLMNKCTYIDNDHHQEIKYQCHAFYEPVIQELQQNKQSLIDYKNELKKKFTPVKTSGIEDDEYDQQSRNKRGVMAVLPFILQVARLIGRNYERIIPITQQVNKFMEVTMPKIKHQIIREGFKANINSDISYYAIERPEKAKVNNIFDFTFDDKLIKFHQQLNKSFTETYQLIENFRKLLEDSTPSKNKIPGGEYLFTRYYDQAEDALIRNFIFTKYSYNHFRLKISIPYDPIILQEKTWSINSDKVIGECISENKGNLKVQPMFEGMETKCLSSNAAKKQISDEIFILKIKDKLFFSNILVINSLDSMIRVVCPDGKETFYPINGFAIIAAGGHCHIYKSNSLVTPAEEGVSMMQTVQLWTSKIIVPDKISQIASKSTNNSDTDVIQYILIGILCTFQIIIIVFSNQKIKDSIKNWYNDRSSAYQVREAFTAGASRLSQLPSRISSRRPSLRRVKTLEEGIAIATNRNQNIISKTEPTNLPVHEIV